MAAAPLTKDLPRTLGELRRSRFSEERLCRPFRKGRNSRKPDLPLAAKRTAVSGHRRIRRHRSAAGRQCRSVAAQFHSAGPARPGQDATDPHAHDVTGRVLPYVAGCEIHDNPYRPICRRCRDTASPRWATKRRSLGCIATSATSRNWRRPDVTIADMIGDIDPIKAARRGHNISRRADHPLRSAAARQSRHLRHQRTARSGGQDPGRLVQHHAGRRRADQRLPVRLPLDV